MSGRAQHIRNGGNRRDPPTLEASMRIGLSRTLIVLALFAPSAANAADVSRPPPYKAVPFVNWTGFYLGAYGGASGATGSNFGLRGGLAGGTVGYNWQNGVFVFGIEGDGGWAGLWGSTGCPLTPLISCTASDHWLTSLRGRIGWTPVPALLLYATAGGAFGDVVMTTTDPAFPGASGDRAGWSAGGGFEWMFVPNWSFKAEYLHYDLATLVCGVGLCAPGVAANGHLAVDTAKFGFNYHFNWGPAAGPY
jgi:outer membrane immunogenic protein